MSTSEALALMSEVEALASPSFSLESNVALIQWDVLPYPAWLCVGVVDDHAACWLAGTQPGPLVECDQSRVLSCSGVAEARVLAGLSAAAQVSRAEHDADGAVRLRCSRDDALVDIRLAGGDDGLIVILDRRLSRRRQRVADIALAGELVDALHALGAQILA